MRRTTGFRIVVRKYGTSWYVYDEYNFVPGVSGWAHFLYACARWETALEYALAVYRNDTRAMYQIRLDAAKLCKGF